MESAGGTAGAATGIRIDGVDLHVTEAGAGSPVLLIHASGFDGDWPPALLDALAPNHRVIAYDRRGYSRSAHPPIRDYHRHAEDAAALLRELDAAPATVVGYSAGGLVALDLAVGHPDLVTSLLLVEPPLYGRKHIDFSQRWFHKTTREVEEAVPQTKVRTMSGVNHALAAAKPADFARMIHEAAASSA